MKILYITPYFPYPLVSGGVLSIYQRIKSLAGNGCIIDLFSLSNRRVSTEEVSHIKSFTRKCVIYRRAAGLALIVAGFCSAVNKSSIFLNLIPKEFYYVLQDALKIDLYDLIICEHSFMGQWFLKRFPENNELLVSVINNIEHDWYYYMYKNERIGMRKVYFYLEQRALKQIEDMLFSSKTRFLFLSGLERSKILDNYQIQKESKVIPLLPIDLNVDKIPDDYYERSPILTFVARLDSPRNINAIQFFLNEIFPKIISAIPSASIQIVGRGAQNEFIRELMSKLNVHYIGPVDDLTSVYRKSKIVVVPILESIGAQTKLFEAVREMCIVVCTSAAVKGTIFDSESGVIVAESAQAFAQKCIDICQGTYDVNNVFLSIQKLGEKYNSYAFSQLVKQFVCESSKKEI